MSFPNYVQLDSMDCGPTCLRIIAAFYGKRYSLQNLREKCHITREGVSLLGISDAAEAIGFRTAGVKLTWEQLRDEANLPCVVHWNQHHFVVVYKVEKHRGQWWVYISDPASDLLKYSEEQFKKSWLQSFDQAGRICTDRETKSLTLVDGLDARNPQKQEFTLFYLSLSVKKSEVQFIVTDNFGQQRTLTVSFEAEESVMNYDLKSVS